MSRYCFGTTFIDNKKIKRMKDKCGESVSSELPNIEGAYHVDYGYDHACGFFIDFFNLEDADRVRQIDSLFYGLTKEELEHILMSLEDFSKSLDYRGIFSCN